MDSLLPIFSNMNGKHTILCNKMHRSMKLNQIMTSIYFSLWQFLWSHAIRPMFIWNDYNIAP